MLIRRDILPTRGVESPLTPLAKGEREKGVGGFCLRKSIAPCAKPIQALYPYQPARRGNHAYFSVPLTQWGNHAYFSVPLTQWGEPAGGGAQSPNFRTPSLMA